MRFVSRSGCLNTVPYNKLRPSCCARRSFVRVANPAEERGTTQRYQTLGEYLQRLPRGLRDVLLWSPAIAAAYFMFYKQPTYYLPCARRRLLSRPVASTPKSEAEKSRSGGVVSIRLDGPSGAVVKGVVLAVLDADGTTLESCANSASSPSPPVPPFIVGITDCLMRLQMVREPETGKVKGYTLV